MQPSHNKHHKDLSFKMLYARNNKDVVIPPYLRKRLKRFKSIYETMHNDHNYAKNSQYFGHLEYLRKNEIPNNEILTQPISQKYLKWNLYQDYKKHHHLRSNEKIKRVRSKPEAGIMQKKLKIF